MATRDIILKDTNESRTYNVADFVNDLASGETISTATITSSPAGLTVGATVISGTVVKAPISGGTPSQTYTLTVQITTSLSSTIEECVKVSVHPCGWLVEMLVMLRFMINDLDDPQTYSDARLGQILCMAAQYVQQELTFLPNVYLISVSELTIAPDPLVINDLNFITFTVLKAACFIDQSNLRTRAALAGVRAILGPMSLDTQNMLQGFIKVLETGPCASYNEMKLQYGFGNQSVIHAVLSPFVNNKFDPRVLYGSSYRGNYHHHDDPTFC